MMHIVLFRKIANNDDRTAKGFTRRSGVIAPALSRASAAVLTFFECASALRGSPRWVHCSWNRSKQLEMPSSSTSTSK